MAGVLVHIRNGEVFTPEYFKPFNVYPLEGDMTKLAFV